MTATTPGRATLFDRILIANRGEIARRISATARRLGISPVAVYSDADRRSRHVVEADTAVRIGPAPAAESYLVIDRIIEAARSTGAQAIHPGYGFLSENAAFAEACQAAGLVFIGPPPAAIAAMGDKVGARALAATAGVPVVPGAEATIESAGVLGYPVVIKPAAGGGGTGMRVVTDPTGFAEALAAARREARQAFGDDRVFIERYVDLPRHIEIQVIVDAHGNAVHLGERECSLQRRHQKIVEEAPSPFLTVTQRSELGEMALAVARACDYRNIGTVEFIIAADDPAERYFIEMNTRLQVEHPVTEMVWGVDLVETQIRIAAGEAVDLGGRAPRGHAIEVRVTAEDPESGFVPSPGRLAAFHIPERISDRIPDRVTDDADERGAVEATVRIDSGVVAGDLITPFYDSMIAKVIVGAPTRSGALDALDRVLAETAIVGVRSNVGHLRRLLRLDAVRAGDLDTGLVARHLDECIDGLDPDVVVAAAIADIDRRGDVDGERFVERADPWFALPGWRLGRDRWITWRARHRDQTVGVAVSALGGGRWLTRPPDLDPTDPEPGRAGGGPVETVEIIDDGRVRTLTVAGRELGHRVYRTDGALWITAGGDGHEFVADGPVERASAAERSGTAVSPMPGAVVVVAVTAGDMVVADQPLVVIEAMKTEYTLCAPFDGRVDRVLVAVGDQVALGAELVHIEPDGGDSTHV